MRTQAFHTKIKRTKVQELVRDLLHDEATATDAQRQYKGDETNRYGCNQKYQVDGSTNTLGVFKWW